MTRALALLLTLGYLLLVPFCFFGGMVITEMVMPGMDSHAHELASCPVGVTVGCMQLADPHAPTDTHGDMYLSLTETPLQSGILLLALLAVGFAVLRINGAQLACIPVHDVMRIMHLRAPRAYTRRDLFARLALFEASPNFA